MVFHVEKFLSLCFSMEVETTQNKCYEILVSFLLFLYCLRSVILFLAHCFRRAINELFNNVILLRMFCRHRIWK